MTVQDPGQPVRVVDGLLGLRREADLLLGLPRRRLRLLLVLLVGIVAGPGGSPVGHSPRTSTCARGLAG